MSKFYPMIEILKSILPSRMKGKTIMWWITVNILAMCWYGIIADKALDGSIAVIYAAALAAFAGTKINETITDRRIKPRPAPDTDEGGL
jgi:hypothetical protein